MTVTVSALRHVTPPDENAAAEIQLVLPKRLKVSHLSNRNKRLITSCCRVWGYACRLTNRQSLPRRHIFAQKRVRACRSKNRYILTPRYMLYSSKGLRRVARISGITRRPERIRRKSYYNNDLQRVARMIGTGITIDKAFRIGTLMRKADCTGRFACATGGAARTNGPHRPGQGSLTPNWPGIAEKSLECAACNETVSFAAQVTAQISAVR